MKILNISNRKFGRLTAIKRLGPYKHGGSLWECVCDCGTITTVKNQYLTSGHTQSCGCLMKERLLKSNITHGLCKINEYKIWKCIRQRLYNPKCPEYEIYGGRGITLCDRWELFVNFLSDMGRRPSNKYSIDRIDVNGNYEPSNCRWATSKEQGRNKRSNHWIMVDGESKTLSEWAEIAGIKPQTINKRIKRGWTTHQAVWTPLP